MTVRPQFVRLIIWLLLCFAVLAVWIWIERRPVADVAPPAGKQVVIDKSAHAQNERKAFIDGLVERGLVRPIEPRRNHGSLRVSLRPTFYMIDGVTRKEYIDVIYAYYFDGSNI